MDTKLVNEAVNDLKEKMEGALTYMSLVSKGTGQSIIGVNFDPAQDVQVLQAINILSRGVSIGHYTILDTKAEMVSTIHFNEYLLLIKYDKTKMNLGMYMGVVLPGVIKNFQTALS